MGCIAHHCAAAMQQKSVGTYNGKTSIEVELGERDGGIVLVENTGRGKTSIKELGP